MGRKLHYKRGSFYRVDDRTGFPQRAEVTRKEWSGLIVDEKVWEPRQPQDLVKGVPDIQAVPDPRPLGANVFVSAIYLQVSVDVAVLAYVIPVTSLAYVTLGDTCAVILADGSLFRTVITGMIANGPNGPAVVIDPFNPLPLPVPSGYDVIDYRIPYSGVPALTQYLAAEDGTPLLTESGELIEIELTTLTTESGQDLETESGEVIIP